MTEAAVTLHTLSERELNVVESALAVSIETLDHMRNIERVTHLDGFEEYGGVALLNEMRDLLLKIQAAR